MQLVWLPAKAAAQAQRGTDNVSMLACLQVSSFGSLPRVRSSASMGGRREGVGMSKVESIASSAVRVADKIQARNCLQEAPLLPVSAVDAGR